MDGCYEDWGVDGERLGFGCGFFCFLDDEKNNLFLFCRLFWEIFGIVSISSCSDVHGYAVGI